MLKTTKFIYTSESEIRRPKDFIIAFVHSLPQAHALGYRLFLRNLRGMYRQSMLGVFWSIIPPLITSLIWIFLNGQRVINIEIPGVSYPLFVIVGTTLWQTFAEGITAPVRGVAMGKSMLTKINFPRESLILSGIYEAIFNTLIKVGLLVVVFIGFDQMPPISAFFGVLGFVPLILLGSTIGILLTPFAMLYNDIQKGIVIVLQFAIYLTPVIYPTPKEGLASRFMEFNPVAPLLDTSRNLILGSPNSELSTYFLVGFTSIVLFLTGVLIYRVTMPIIIERLGS